MTAADRAGGYDARCVLLLARLRLLARADAGAPLPPGAAGEVGQVVGAIVAEADAAVTAVADSGHRSAAVFLAPRQARLAAAAGEVIAALTSALWTVQHAVCAPAHRRPRPAPRAAPAP